MIANQETEILRMIGDMKGEIGEIRGQLREVNHNLNNLSMKFDGIGAQVQSQRGLSNDVADLKARVAILEAMENKRAGAIGFGAWAMKSPLIGWLATAAVGVWALMSGKVGQ